MIVIRIGKFLFLHQSQLNIIKFREQKKKFGMLSYMDWTVCFIIINFYWKILPRKLLV